MEPYSWQLTTIAISLALLAIGGLAALAGLILLVSRAAKAADHADKLLLQADYLMTRLRLWSVEVEEKAKHAGIYMSATNWNLRAGLKILAVLVAALKSFGNILSALLGGKRR